jgi:hypothetical protein
MQWRAYAETQREGSSDGDCEQGFEDFRLSGRGSQNSARTQKWGCQISTTIKEGTRDVFCNSFNWPHLVYYLLRLVPQPLLIIKRKIFVN